jgi:hypothetical protein
MYRVSKLIASASVNFSLKNDSGTIVIDFINNCDIDSLLMELSSDDFDLGNCLSLHFENLKGNDLLPVVDVYLNLYDECVPNEKNYVGAMALYGLSESSTESHEHDGSGQHRVFDVSQVFSTVCSQCNWSKKHFKLTLVPYHSLQIDASLTIGRIALYFNES